MPLPSAFLARPVEPASVALHAAHVRRPARSAPFAATRRIGTRVGVSLLALLSVSACAAAPEPGSEPLARVTTARPAVPAVLQLPAGARIRTAMSSALPDKPEFRVAAVWWREALRQSVRFDVGDEAGPEATATLVLGVDVEGRRLAAFCRMNGRERALAGEAYQNGDLAGAIDRLAWAARIAIGEADATPPVPVARCVTTSGSAILAAVDGEALLRDGGVSSGRRAFLAARRADGGSPWVLAGLATIELVRGDPRSAERLCREALGYSGRLGPHTRHELARTLLLARASLVPTNAPERDRELLALGQAMQRERPHDPQGRFTVAIARNFLGEFATALPLLEELRLRLPRYAVVSYHAGWAHLATGDPETAAARFEDAGLRLPMGWVAIPRALALFDCGDHDGLTRLLDRYLRDAASLGPEPVHELRRIQAAHALLRGDEVAAATAIADSLNWLLANPTLLDRRPGELAEQGEVLVRLGHGERLPAIVAAIQSQLPGSAVADSCAYLSGLVTVTTTRQRARKIEERLSQGGDSAFALRLRAFGHEVRGELADMHAALARAARASDSALTKALLAKSLIQMGRGDDGRALRTALRRELTTIALRRRPSHPLLGPELAYAYRLQ